MGASGGNTRYTCDGGRGGTGGLGGPGTDAGDGTDGTDGADQQISFKALNVVDHNRLLILVNGNNRVQCSVINYIGVYSRGGEGGDGGEGGKGGDGGAGGPGGPGGYWSEQVGRSEYDSYSESYVTKYHTESGTGRTGPQGFSGPRGTGGDGGAGGNGGNIILRADHCETSIFMTVVADSNGAPGGSAGSGGYGGRDGCDGRAGRDGTGGTVEYRVTMNNGANIKERGWTRYELYVINYSVTPRIDDGVFEPGEELFFSNLVLQNTGSISLPKGSRIFFPSSQTFESYSAREDPFVVPVEIPPRSTYKSTFKFSGRIKMPDLESFSYGYIFRGTSTFHTVGTLLSREFSNGKVPGSIDCVRFPVFAEVSPPSYIGENDKSFKNVVVKISNISRFDYGWETNRGDVSVQMEIKNGLLMESWNSPGQTDTICVVDILHIRAGRYIEVIQRVQLDEEIEIHERGVMTFSILYKKLCIQKMRIEIRCAPEYYEPDENTNCLFVNDQSMQRQDYLLYDHIFQGLGIECRKWDMELNRGFSFNATTLRRHKLSWVGKHDGTIVIVHLSSETNREFLFKALHPKDLEEFFRGRSLGNTGGWVIVNPPDDTVHMRSDFQRLFLRGVKASEEDIRAIPANFLRGKYLSAKDVRMSALVYKSNEYLHQKMARKEFFGDSVCCLDKFTLDPDVWTRYLFSPVDVYKLGGVTVKKVSFDRNHRLIWCYGDKDHKIEVAVNLPDFRESWNEERN